MKASRETKGIFIGSAISILVVGLGKAQSPN
jgi:hypothetical protein